MAELTSTVSVLEGVAPDQIPFDELLEANEPVILRGLVSNWELVKAGKASPEKAMELLERHSSGRPVGVYIAPSDTNARFSYNDDCTGFNYEHQSIELGEILAQIRANQGDPEHAYYYMNSLTLDESFPGLREQNDLQFNHPEFANNKPLAKVWLGTESMASAHYDVPSNLACCVLGPRRFTLFPPEQIHNLYPGPMEPTPGGQVVTMVDFRNPDYERFPRARQALDAALVVDLEPGDAVFYPSMWWHQVEAFAPFNIMINYWWRTAPAYMGNPLDIVMHAILGLRDRSESEKKAWREVFDYYVFGSPEKPREHLPPAAHGPLADVDDNGARRRRALVKNGLNR
jgi:hypothetical protein